MKRRTFLGAIPLSLVFLAPGAVHPALTGNDRLPRIRVRLLPRMGGSDSQGRVFREFSSFSRAISDSVPELTAAARAANASASRRAARSTRIIACAAARSEGSDSAADTG